MIAAEFDFGTVSALVNFLAALGVLWIMQAVTVDAGFSSRFALTRFVHRLALAGLAVMLFGNAGLTVHTRSAPRLIDLLVQVAMLLAVIISASRHRWHSQAP